MKIDKNLVLTLLLILSILMILNLCTERNHLQRLHKRELKNAKNQSQKVIKTKTKEIKELKKDIENEKKSIDNSFNTINSLQKQKQKVKTVYIEKVQEINTYDANELKKYFRDELK